MVYRAIPGKFLMRVNVYSPADLEAIQVILNDNSVRNVLIAYHTGGNCDNPHIHLVLDTDYTIETFRARCKRLWTLSKQFSLKGYKVREDERDDESPYIYVFHEKDKDTFVCWWKNFHIKNDIGRWAKQAKSKNKERSSRDSVSVDGEVKRKRVPTFTEVLLEEALTELKPGGLLKTKVFEGHVMPIGKNEVLRFIIQKYGKNRKVFDKFIINRMYSLLAWHLFGEEFEDEMVGQVLML